MSGLFYLMCTYTGKFATTDMNTHSSRSHVIFTVTIEQSDIGPDKEQHVRMGKLHLVDLAVRSQPLPSPLNRTGHTRLL